MSISNRIGIGEPHAHMGESVESLSASSFILLLQSFSGILNERHLPRIIVFDSVRISMGEPHEHGRIASAWENPIRI